MTQICKYYLLKEYENTFVTFWRVDAKPLKNENKNMDLEDSFLQYA